MKVFFGILIISIAFFLVSCNDSTVDPAKDGDLPSQMVSHTWVPLCSSNDSMPSINGVIAPKIKFNSNHTCTFTTYNRIWNVNGEWAYDEGAKNLTITCGSENYICKVKSVSDTRLVLEMNINGTVSEVRYMLDDNDTGYMLTGKLKFVDATTLPTDADLVVLWIVGGDDSGSYMTVVGKGNIYPEDSTFSIAFSSPQLDEIAVNRYDANNAIGIAHILVMGHNVLVEGEKYSNWYADNQWDYFESQTYGMLNDGNMLYFQGTIIQQEFFWGSQFSTGFSVGRGWYRDQGHDGFIPRSPHNLMIYITNDMDKVQIINYS